MKIQVQIVQGPAADCTFTIEKNSRCVVGRGEEADYSINNDELISRQHFQIEFDGKAITLMDLGSTNGTFVDGQPLVKNRPVYLNNGQSFIAGRVSEFVVNMVGQHVEPPVASAPTQVPFSPSPVDSQNPMPSPPTNFGSSIYTAGEGPPVSSSSSAPEQAGGNFSQSIVKGIGGISGVGDSGEIFDVTEQSGLLLPNPSPAQGIELGTGGAQGPSPSFLPPGSVDENQGGGPSDVDLGPDYHGSISAPGDVDGVAYQFAPLDGEEPSPEPPPTKSETPTPVLPKPTPAEIAEPPEASPAASPFASVQRGPTGSPAAASPLPSAPTQPVVNPTEQIPSPTSPPPVSRGSISSPDSMSPVQSYPASGLDSDANTGSIGLPNQMPTDQPKTPLRGRPNEETAVPPGKVGFYLRQQANGLFFHSGMDLADLDQVLETLQKSFESIYCADLTRAGIENAPIDPEVDQKPETEADAEVGSNFVGLEVELEASSQSPFESLKEEPEEELPSEEPTEEEATSSRRIGTPLFFWLPKEVRWDHPVLLTKEEFSFEIKDFWQADALICFFGSSAKQMSEHCLELIKTDIRTGKQGNSMFGFCWPTVLGCTFESAREKAVNLIFEGGVAAVLIEDPQEEMAWNIVSKNDLTELLTTAGFVRKNQ